MGFMGTGKSEVGRRLAQRLGRAVRRHRPARRERAPASASPTIFADDGEAALPRARARRGRGGGRARRRGDRGRRRHGARSRERRAVCAAPGPLVYLTARPETILGARRRRSRTGRCSATRRSAGGRSRGLLGERAGAYAAAADLTVDTSQEPEDGRRRDRRVAGRRASLTVRSSRGAMEVVNVELGDTRLSDLRRRRLPRGIGARVARDAVWKAGGGGDELDDRELSTCRRVAGARFGPRGFDPSRHPDPGRRGAQEPRLAGVRLRPADRGAGSSAAAR